MPPLALRAYHPRHLFEGKTVKQHSEEEYVTVYAIYKRLSSSVSASWQAGCGGGGVSGGGAPLPIGVIGVCRAKCGSSWLY